MGPTGTTLPTNFQALYNRAMGIVFASSLPQDEKTTWFHSLHHASPPMLWTFIELCENDAKSLRQATELLLVKIDMKNGKINTKNVLKREQVMFEEAAREDERENS